MNDLIRGLNREISRWAERVGVAFIDPHPLFADERGALKPEYDFGDGAHLNLKGYELLGRFVADQISKILIPGVRIGCLGDSTTEGYPYSLHSGIRFLEGQEEFKSYPDYLRLPGVTVVNFGIAGDTTSGMLARAQEIVPGSLDFCLVMGGTNDLLMGHDIDAIVKNLVSIYSVLRSSEIEPIALGVLPVRTLPL